MKLRQYLDADFDVVKTWVNDERVHMLWCANLIHYPLEKSNFEEVLRNGAERLGEFPFIAETDEGTPAGFICYSQNDETKTGMLRFVILDPSLRGKGYGKEMVRLTAQYGFEERGADAVRLVVFSANEAAKYCYLSAGFTEQDTTEKAFQYKEEQWGRCNMIIKRRGLMKTIILNASPRKNWNTAQMLKEAEKGAKSVGAETEYIDLYDLNFTGCRSCLACKRKDAERNKCYWKDDLSPVIEKILQADAVIIGAPIYFGEPTANFRALLERLAFCMLSYDGGERSYFKGTINAGFVYTMNAPKEYYENLKQQALAGPERILGGFLNGKVMTVAACSTTQVDDYSKFAMGMFDPEERKDKRENQFPLDLMAAFDLGAELSK